MDAYDTILWRLCYIWLWERRKRGWTSESAHGIMGIRLVSWVCMVSSTTNALTSKDVELRGTTQHETDDELATN